MYEGHFGLERPPFQITPDPSLFFEGGKRGAVLDALVYAIERGEGIVKVVGEVGSGKTMICRMLEVRVSANTEIIYIANPSLGPDDILMVIADELDLKLATGTGKHEVMRALQRHLVDLHGQGKQVVIFVEEAQGMPLETLEEIRLLSNLETGRHKLLQIVLFGQPELDENLSLRSIRQLRERISHSFELAPLTPAEICRYLNFRMRQVGYTGPDLITAKVGRAIGRYSDGLIRRVNILADKTLLAAYSANTHSVTARHVKDAARDSAFPKFRHARGREAPRRLLVGGAATLSLLLAGLGAWLLLGGALPPSTTLLAPADDGLQGPSDSARLTRFQGDVGPEANRDRNAGEPEGAPDPAADPVAVATPAPVQASEAPASDQVVSAPAEKRLRESRASLTARDLVGVDAEGIPRALTEAGHRWLESKVRQGEAWKAKAGTQRITLQMMTREKEAAHDLVWNLHRHWPLDLERTYIDEFQGRRAVVYRVFYGDFDDWQAGREALAGLPSAILRSGPYLRRIPGVELATAEPDPVQTAKREPLAQRGE